MLASFASQAQYNSPAIDAVINAGEYGGHSDGQNQQTNSGSATVTYMTWDATNLYVAITGANVGEGFVIYIDKDPQTPVNGGTNANGTIVGNSYDGTNFIALQFRADLVAYVKNGYREYRTANGSNGWSAANTAFGAYADNAQFNTSGIREIAISWSSIGGIPASFNWFAYLTSNGGFVYGTTPVPNAGGTIGASARYERYYTVSTTTNTAATKPFSRESYVFNFTAGNNSFGAVSVYDFTMNSAGLQISRGTTGGNWVIGGNLVVTAGSIFFGSGTSSYGTTNVGNISVSGGTLNMDQTTQSLNVSGNCNINSGSFLLSSVSGGDLNVGGNFSNSGTFTPNNRAITFNGSGPQTISGLFNSGTGPTNILTFVTIANTSANVTSASDINISGSLTVNANARLDVGATSLRLNTGSASNVSGYLRSANANGLTLSGSASLSFSSTGTYEHNYNASGQGTLGFIPTATWNTGSTCAIIGLTNPGTGAWFASSSANQSFGNFTWNTPGLSVAPNMGGAALNVNGTFMLLSTGSTELRLGSSASGVINCANFSQSGGILNLSNGTGTGTLNCAGSFFQTAGTITELGSGSGTINLIQSSGVQSLIVGGTVSNNITWNIGNGTTTNTVQFGSNVAAGAGVFNVVNNSAIDFGNYILTGSNNFNLQSGASLLTGNVNGIYAATAIGSVQNTGSRMFDPAANFSYNGSSAQVTGTGLTAANNLTINNSNGVTLVVSVTVNNVLSLQSGSLSLGTSNITIANSAASAITGYSSVNFIKTNSTGELRRAIGIIGFPLNYTFPVGITSYTPVSYTFNDNTVATNMYVRVIEATHPSVSTTDYIQNRYWVTNLSDASGTYSYSATYNFITGDIVGNPSNIKLVRWNGSSWGSITVSTCSGTTLNSGPVTESSAPLQSTAQWCGRSSPSPTNYTWNTSGTGSWTNATNWSPPGVPGDGDAVSFNNASVSVVTNVPTGIRLMKFLVSGNTNVTFQTVSSGTLNIGGGTSPQFNVAASSTVMIAGSQGLALNIISGNSGTVQGTIQLKDGPHKITAESSTGLSFGNGSYFAAGVSAQTGYSGNPFGINGVSNTVVFQSGSSFEQFEGSNPFASAQPSSKVSFLPGSLYKFSNTNAIAVPSFSGRTYANFEYNVGLAKSVTGSSAFSMQNLTITQGSFTIGLTATSSISGNISIAGGSTLDFNPVSASIINMNGNTQSIAVNGTGIFSIGANGTLAVTNGTTVNMIAESFIKGTGTFTLNSGATIGVASVNGISSSAPTGNIQTTTRNFNSAANYVYNGSSSQVTGTGLPLSLNAALTIANTGALGNNIVTLSNNSSTVSTLNLTSGKFAVGTAQQLNIRDAGAVNGTSGDFSPGSTAGILNFNGSGLFSGNLNPYNVYASGAVNFGSGTVTIQNGGTFRINPGGYADINSPYYSTGSTLQYYSNGVYNLRTEWSAVAGRGYPYNVALSNNTVLNYPYSGNIARTVQGNLQIDAGSSLYMDYGSLATNKALTVAGDITIDGNLSLGDADGGDLNIGGNWKRTGTFNSNNREVVFNGSSLQSITGATSFAYLKIDKGSSTLKANSPINVANRLWLNNGTFDPDGNNIIMANASLLRRSAATAIMTLAPTSNTGDSYDMQYDATMTTGNEFLNDQNKIRDLIIVAGTLTMGGDKTFNRDLKLSGDVDLGSFTLTDRGNNTSSTASGNIEIISGNRIITGAAGSIFKVAGIGGNNPSWYTKIVTNPGAGTLNFGSNTTVQIGDGRMDFGVNNPVTINGILQIALGGSVYSNACYYGTNSILRFANTVDYQVTPTDVTWSPGAINSGLPGIPYQVEILNAGTDLTLQSARALRSDLAIIDGTFTMTASSGTFNIGGNWSRSGFSSSFIHNNQKVIFNRQSAGSQTITSSNTITGETFYDLETSLFNGTLDLSPNTDLTVLNSLNLLSGNLTINSNTVTLNGTVSGASTFTGSSTSNIIVGGTTGGTIGTLKFSSGNQLLNNFSITRTGLGATASLGTDLELKGMLAVNNPATLTMGSSGELLTISGNISGAGSLSGSSSANLTIAGSGSSAGTLNFTPGSQVLNTLMLARTGTAPAVVLGTSLSSNALTLNNGILVTDNNLLTINTASGITLPAVYTDSYVCLCNAAGTSTMSITKPFNGLVGLRINNIGNSDNYFPVGVDFVSPNKLWLRNYGDVDDFTVAMEKGDIGLTEKSRVNRIWYIKQANPNTKYVTADMRLYFTKRDWINNPFLSAQDEVENGFLWNDSRLIHKNYNDPNYLNVAQSTDIKNWSAASYNTEVYGQYTYGISSDINNIKNGIDTFTRFSVANMFQIILPVTIINVNAMQIAQQVKVDWTSLTEVNLAYYSVEHSYNATTFLSIGTVQATDKGTRRADYYFTDINPLAGNNYYRIKAIDRDGKIAYSAVVKINIVSKNAMAIYPNPVAKTGVLNIGVSKLQAGQCSVILIDINGKKIDNIIMQHNGGYFYLKYKLPKNIAPGIYFVNIISSAQLIKQKIIVQ